MREIWGAGGVTEMPTGQQLAVPKPGLTSPFGTQQLLVFPPVTPTFSSFQSLVCPVAMGCCLHLWLGRMTHISAAGNVLNQARLHSNLQTQTSTAKAIK